MKGKKEPDSTRNHPDIWLPWNNATRTGLACKSQVPRMDVENEKEIIGNLNRTDQMVTLHKWNDELK